MPQCCQTAIVSDFAGPHIRPPLLLDIQEDVIELIQLVLWVIWFCVDGDHHQVLQNCGGHAKNMWFTVQWHASWFGMGHWKKFPFHWEIVSSTCVQTSEAQDVRIPCENISSLGHLVIKLIGAHQVHHVVSTHKPKSKAGVCQCKQGSKSRFASMFSDNMITSRQPIQILTKFISGPSICYWASEPHPAQHHNHVLLIQTCLGPDAGQTIREKRVKWKAPSTHSDAASRHTVVCRSEVCIGRAHQRIPKNQQWFSVWLQKRQHVKVPSKVLCVAWLNCAEHCDLKQQERDDVMSWDTGNSVDQAGLNLSLVILNKTLITAQTKQELKKITFH